MAQGNTFWSTETTTKDEENQTCVEIRTNEKGYNLVRVEKTNVFALTEQFFPQYTFFV